MNRFIIAGMLACSNLGLRVAMFDLERALRSNPSNVTDGVIPMCACFIEDGVDEALFQEEAEMWYTHVKDLSEEELARSHPSTVVQLREAMGAVA